MSCIDKKSSFNETVNVPVMYRLSPDPAIPVDFESFLAKVWFALGIYLSFVWSRFKIRLSGILWSSTRDKVSRKYKSWAFFFAPFAISILPVVFVHVFEPILQKSFLPKMISPGQYDLELNVGS